MQSNKIKIDKGIEIPDGHTYPFKGMKAGDSFFLPSEGVSNKYLKKRVSTSAHYYNKKNKVKIHITTRDVEGGIRVWLVEEEKNIKK